MKNKKALEILEQGKDNFDRIDDIYEAFKQLAEWAGNKELGQVYLDYYDELGKTVTLSIAFREYWTTLNEKEVGLLAGRLGEDFLEETVDFSEIHIQLEDEGQTDNFALSSVGVGSTQKAIEIINEFLR